MTLSDLNYESLGSYQKKLYKEYSQAVKINISGPEAQFFDEVGFLVIRDFEPVDLTNCVIIRRDEVPPETFDKEVAYCPSCAYKSRNPMHPKTNRKKREYPMCSFISK